jgi:hypothetical protein
MGGPLGAIIKLSVNEYDSDRQRRADQSAAGRRLRLRDGPAELAAVASILGQRGCQHGSIPADQ